MSIKIHGGRVYLNMPELPEFKTSIPDSLKEEIKKETAEKFEKLIVYASGVDFIKVGDVVGVDPSALQKGRIIKIDGGDRLIVASYDIMHTWDVE